MMTTIVFKNQIPTLLSNLDMSISDLQRETNLSYPGLHRIASKKTKEISPRTEIGTLQSIATVLDVAITDLYTIDDA